MRLTRPMRRRRPTSCWTEIFTGSERVSQEPVKIVGQCADMSHQPDRPSRSGPTRGALSRDAGLLRIRALTKGAAVTAAVGSVALGVVLAQPAQSQAASSPAAASSGAGTDN